MLLSVLFIAMGGSRSGDDLASAAKANPLEGVAFAVPDGGRLRVAAPPGSGRFLSISLREADRRGPPTAEVSMPARDW